MTCWKPSRERIPCTACQQALGRDCFGRSLATLAEGATAGTGDLAALALVLAASAKATKMHVGTRAIFDNPAGRGYALLQELGGPNSSPNLKALSGQGVEYLEPSPSGLVGTPEQLSDIGSREGLTQSAR